MESGYRIIFIGKSLYNEIEVPQDPSLLGVGTIPGCRARFSDSSFHQNFLALISRTKAGWHIQCEFGVYLRPQSQPVAETDFQHGDMVSLYSCTTHEELFKLTCTEIFDGSTQCFDAKIDFSGLQRLIIGNHPDSNLHLLDLENTNESFKLENTGTSLRLVIEESSLGIYVNGCRTVGITQIRDRDFFSCGPYSFYFQDTFLYFTNKDRIQLHGVSSKIIVESVSSLTYPKFNRNTRIKECLSREPIAILDPPEIPQKPSDSLLMTLFPSLAMLILVVVLRGIMSANAGMYVIFSVCSMSLGIFTSIINFKKSRKKYAQSLDERTRVYNDYIARKRTELEEARKAEAETLGRIYPSVDETAARVLSFSGDLFDRTLADEDFLHIRLGTGRQEALRKISYKPRESLVLGDDLQNTPEQLSREYQYLANVPVIVDLKSTGILGLVGPSAETGELMKVIIEDLCTRQYSKDASMFAVCTDEQAAQYKWMRFLPHFQKETGLSRNIACDKSSCEMQFEYLFKTLTLRESLSKHAVFPAIVVFVLDQMGLYTHPVSKYLENSREFGVYFVFLCENREELPLYCGNIIQLKGNSCGSLIETADLAHAVDFHYETISDSQMWQIALKLAPVYCEDISVESSLPKSFSLFSLLGIQNADDLDLASRWRSTDITKTMAAPIGLKSGNEIVYLDLHEKFHGPHGLVAGTTGSGKSEILQTYILSMATLFPPDEIGFVIIDFKGGGMANLFSELPHLMGAITDIDGKALERSLLSIRAEIDKRKRMFADAEVNNITDYIRKYKSGSVLSPLPHLILIIDEFAELKASQPEFMKAIISAARVGRSLGIHLILATQKPGGVIDDQIWSNSQFKLCLKVQSKSDSNEVLKSPLAAEIREPGRAYLQVGNNEIFDLFQSAYSGCPAQSEEIDHIQPFQLFTVDICGRKNLLYERKKAVPEGNEQMQTQLEAITERISNFCHNSGITKLPNICMPPLPNILPYSHCLPPEASGIWTDIGIYDDPANQYQGVISIDLEENNVLTIGSTQCGKSNLLMTMIRSLTMRYSPSQVNLYIIDFGPSILSNFRHLPHVGGVVTDREDEKLKNLFKMLSHEIELRKDRLSEAEVSSFKSYRQAGYQDMPMIVLIVDNFTALKELYFSDNDLLMPICRNGLSVGISVILANSHTQGIGYRYLSNFSRRIALHCNDSGEYSTLIERCRIRLDDIAGRGIVEIDKHIYEFQTYCCFSGDTEILRVEQMNNFINQIQQINQGCTAKAIPEIPIQLSEHTFCTKFSAVRKDTYTVPVGIDYSSLNIVSIDLLQIGAFAVLGQDKSENRCFLQMILSQLQSNLFSTPAQVYLVDSIRKNLKEYQNMGITEAYTIDPSELSAYISQIHTQLCERFNMVNEHGADILKDEPLLMIVVDNMDAVNLLCKDTQSVNKYKEILDKFCELKVCFLYMNVDNLQVSTYSGPEVLRRLKETKSVFFFDSLKKMKFTDISDKQHRMFHKSCHHGDGYYYSDGELSKLKIVTEP